MTLALTGGWAWAELSDPPPGEPGQPPPGEPGQPPPGEPTPPPSGGTGAPLPPLPGDGGPLGPPELGFTWATGGVRAVWDADLKLNASGDPGWDGWENTACGPTAAGAATAWPLPFDPTPDAAPAPTGSPADQQLDWSRNSAQRTLQGMINLNLNLYLHKYSHGPGRAWNGDAACDWLSWSALNDEVQREWDVLLLDDPDIEPVYTGLVLPRLEESFTYSGELANRGVPWCTYRDVAVRLRQEAADHPEIVRLGIVDELYRMMPGPDAMFGGSTNAFTAEHLAGLRALLNEGDPTAEGSARGLCDAAIADEAGGGLAPLYTEAVYSDPLYLGSPFPTDSHYAPEAPVELWARMHAASIPRLIVPSLILGVPKRTDPAVSEVSLADGAYVAATYSLPGGFLPWFSTPAPDWEVRVQYLVHAYTEAPAGKLQLQLFVNEGPQPGATVATTGPTPVASWMEKENIYMIDVPITSSWDASLSGTNTIELRVAAVGGEVSDGADQHVYIFGAKVIIEDKNGIHGRTEQTLDPETASFHALSTPTATPTPCPTSLTCGTTTAYLVGPHLDGVTVAAEIAAPWRRGAGEGWAGVPMARAWETLRDLTRQHMQGTVGPADGRPRRVLSDERAWVSDYDDLELFDFVAAASRIRAGIERAHGVSLVHLVMEVEDVVGGHGRFAEYPSTFTGYPHMNYLPRLTRSHLGEEQVWEFLVPANPSCDGTWTLAYETTSTRDDSSYGPVVQVWDPIGAEWDYAFDVDPDDLLQDLPGLARSGVYLSGTGAVSDVLSTGQPVRFGWGIKNIDGASELGSPIGPTALAWSIEPPVGCPQPLLTQSASFTDERVPDFFDRIGCVLTTSETAACWLGAPPILGGDWSDMFGGAP